MAGGGSTLLLCTKASNYKKIRDYKNIFVLDVKGKGEGAVFGVPINQCIDPARKRSTVDTPTDPEVRKPSDLLTLCANNGNKYSPF